MHVRRLESEDLRTRVAWFNTPSVYEQMVVDLPLSLEATRQWFARNAMNAGRRDFAFVEQTGDDGGDRIVAMGGLTEIDSTHRRAELYIVADPTSSGRGHGSKAVRWLCNFGFSQLALHKIYLYTMAVNDAARRLYERHGFVAEGVLAQHVFHRGRFVDRHVHGLLRGRWEETPWRAQGPVGLEAP